MKKNTRKSHWTRKSGKIEPLFHLTFVSPSRVSTLYFRTTDTSLYEMHANISEPFQLSPANGAQHFFGYYGISPWNANMSRFVCLETTFHDRMPDPGDEASIICIDTASGEHEVIATTRGWNFQQGTMLHWLPSSPERKIIFNDCDKDRAFSRVMDVESGETWELPRPINAVAKHANLAACVSFTRLRKYRRVTSLPCANEYSKGGVHPDDDGIFLMDIEDGSLDLIVSLDDIWKANPATLALPEDDFKAMGMGLWFNHVSFNPSGSRLHFLARYPNIFGGLVTSMWTIDKNGMNPHLLVDFYHRLSHFEWVNDRRLIVTMDWPDPKHKSHVMMEDLDDAAEAGWTPVAPETLTKDGHPAVSPSKKLMATDTYIVDGRRYVYLVDLATHEVMEIHSFDNPAMYNKEVRCDPHCRWSPDGSLLCFDALVDGSTRQILAVRVEND
ncbi:hypothetical protein GF325_16390 [Candidatus Bathyarchaeota archaeon]|nr:hypothetical protein [Candidatus Bathyarchaeota archaeon]